MADFNTSGNNLKYFSTIDNYIYFYHLQKYIILPLYVDNLQDSMGATWNSETPLGRSAPIQSYSGSGPRTVQFNFDLHRDLMQQINMNNSSISKAIIDDVNRNEIVPGLDSNEGKDYVSLMLKYLQTSVVPSYDAATKMVSPPLVAVRMGDDVYIKGVVKDISLTYKPPILRTGKYAVVSVGFSVTEVDPYDATDVAKYGSYRGVNKTLERRYTTLFDDFLSSGGWEIV